MALRELYLRYSTGYSNGVDASAASASRKPIPAKFEDDHIRVRVDLRLVLLKPGSVSQNVAITDAVRLVARKFEPR